MNSDMPSVNLVIVGCGAITEQSYLPTLSTMPQARVVGLVDKNPERARLLAERHGVEHWATSAEQLPSNAEAAIVALPHLLHAPVSRALMRNGLHVFCEKPMATTAEDADAMVRCAAENDVRLQIGTVRRYYWCNKLVKNLVANGELGPVAGFEIEEGAPHDWPTASGFFFDKKQSGGGVLMDSGAHVLDLLLWWLDQTPGTVEYRDDACGGVESECAIELGFGSGANGTIRLSRLRALSNRYTITFDSGRVSYRTYDPSGLSYSVEVERGGRVERLRPDTIRHFDECFADQLDDFFRSIREEGTALAAAETVAPSIRLIEECYRKAGPLDARWLHGDGNTSPRLASPVTTESLKTMKVLVTGASGFIGGRVVERLSLEFDNPPRAALYRFNRAARIARFPVEMVLADVLDYDALLAAAEGCDAIVHGAYGNTGDEELDTRINVTGTDNVLRVARERNVKRVVHLSTIEVYGKDQPEVVTEDTPLTESFDAYGNSKREAEEVCRSHFREHGVPVVILRLAVVYGPYAPIWTTGVVERLLSRGFCMSDRFEGTCNPLYIDDCVDAILLALTQPGLEGQAFVISGGEKVTWNEYFAAHERMLGLPPLRTASDLELQAYKVARSLWEVTFGHLNRQHEVNLTLRYKSLRERGRMVNLRALLRRGGLLAFRDVFERRAYYSIEKARRELGFEPQYSLERGLALIREWLGDRVELERARRL